MAIGIAVRHFKLMGAEADPIGAVVEACIEPARGRRYPSRILHRAILFFDSHDVERRIGKDLGDAHGVGTSIDL